MKSLEEIYSEMRSLVSRVERLSPLLSNDGLTYSFHTKMTCLEIMQKHTLERIRELFKTYKKERKNSIHKKGIGEILDESIAFFEAYLNALCSFLQLIGRLTPYFYDRKGLKKPIPVKFFALQINYFRDNPDVDPEYSNYLKNNMTWHDELSHNRHAVSHNVSAFLGFGEEEIEFFDMLKKRIDFFKNGKPTKKLEEYILDNRDSLFKFLKFYVEHFSNRQIFVDSEEELKEVSKRIRAPTGQTRARS